MARSRGSVSGPLLILLGAWGALVPFIGHYFGYGFTPDNTWGWTDARGWLEVLPGAAVFLGGVVLTISASRPLAMLAGWVAALGGAWFVISPVIAPWWNAGGIGTPTGDTNRMVWEHLGMFTGLGVVIVFLAAAALGRISVVGVRDQQAARAKLDAYDRIEHAQVYPEDSATTDSNGDLVGTGNAARTSEPIRDTHSV